MTDKPDFSDMTGEESSTSDSDSGSQSRTEFKQLHIEGLYGTKTIKNTDGCRVCGRNSNVLLLTNYIGDAADAQWTREIQVCEAHEGDVRGDLDEDQFPVERREF